MGREGFEPSKLSQQIYSLPHLAALEPPHQGAGGGIRTPDMLITNQLLWPTELHRQYSYKKKNNSPVAIKATKRVCKCKKEKRSTMNVLKKKLNEYLGCSLMANWKVYFTRKKRLNLSLFFFVFLYLPP